jgi:predicted acyltransferase (DUF342 family)
MPLIMTGQIAAIRRGEFDGKSFVSIQFMGTDRFGGIRLDTVYVDEGYDVSAYRVGQDVEIPVTASVKKGTTQINFRIHDEKVEAEKATRRQQPTQAAAAR